MVRSDSFSQRMRNPNLNFTIDNFDKINHAKYRNGAFEVAIPLICTVSNINNIS